MERRRRGQTSKQINTSPTRTRTRRQQQTAILLPSSSDDGDLIPQIQTIKDKSKENTTDLINLSLDSSDSDSSTSPINTIPKDNSTDWTAHNQTELERAPKTNQSKPKNVQNDKENPENDLQISAFEYNSDDSGENLQIEKPQKKVKRVRRTHQAQAEDQKEYIAEEPKSIMPSPPSTPNSAKHPKKRKRKVPRKTSEYIPDILTSDPYVSSFSLFRQKHLMGIKSPTFYMTENDKTIYYTKLKETSDGNAFIINTEERIDRFSNTFVGYIKKQESGTRFTLKMPTGKIDSVENKEVLGLYFYHHEDKTRHAFILQPPDDKPYFPANKEVSLSRLAKTMTVPDGFIGYTAHSESPTGYLNSVKNMILTPIGEKSPIIGIFKTGKDIYHIKMFNKYPKIFGFTFALTSIVTKSILK